MIIQQQNLLQINAPKTYLTFGESAGGNVIRWKNGSGFSSNWAVQIGETGEKQTEVAILSSGATTGTAGTLTANTLFDHPSDTPVYGIKYDQIVFEKSTSGTAGTAAPISNGTIGIQADSLYTIFDDTTGTTTDAWKTYYRASVLTVNSIESDWITYNGYTFYSLAKMRERIREKLWSDKFITDSMLNNWINEWREKMRNAAISVNQDFALGTMNVAFGTDGYGTISDWAFKQMRRFDITYNGVDWFMASKMGYTTFLPNQVFNQSHPYFYMSGENTFGVKPESSGGTAKIAYYELGSVLINDADELEYSMRGYTASFISYGLSQAAYKENKPDLGNTLFASAASDLERFKAEISPRSKTGPTYITLSEPMSSDEYWI